ncbi:unnamed protein product [Onchocerca flexuosa]|uniref:Transmembrane protein n=1 Tax=Onchocerca flexuosa TaxID=387005 RepID=A0A183H6V9_9BILA|nr:unnamed protein product [Onchocerca flexuosa]
MIVNIRTNTYLRSFKLDLLKKLTRHAKKSGFNSGQTATTQLLESVRPNNIQSTCSLSPVVKEQIAIFFRLIDPIGFELGLVMREETGCLVLLLVLVVFFLRSMQRVMQRNVEMHHLLKLHVTRKRDVFVS